MTVGNVSIQFECPLHYGEGYDLECLDCRSMPTLMPDGTWQDSSYAPSTPYLRTWAKIRAELFQEAETARLRG